MGVCPCVYVCAGASPRPSVYSKKHPITYPDQTDDFSFLGVRLNIQTAIFRHARSHNVRNWSRQTQRHPQALIAEYPLGNRNRNRNLESCKMLILRLFTVLENSARALTVAVRRNNSIVGIPRGIP